MQRKGHVLGAHQCHLPTPPPNTQKCTRCRRGHTQDHAWPALAVDGVLVEEGKKGGGGRKAKAGPERGQGDSPLRSDIKIIGRASPDPALFSRARSKVLLLHFFLPLQRHRALGGRRREPVGSRSKKNECHGIHDSSFFMEGVTFVELAAR